MEGSGRGKQLLSEGERSSVGDIVILGEAETSGEHRVSQKDH